MIIKENFLSLGKFRIKIGNKIRFEDSWLGNQLLKTQYPTLFNSVHKKQAKVTDISGSVPSNVEFRRALVVNKPLEWNHQVARMVVNINLQQGNDSLVW